jgi:hypothetical protein
MDTLFMVALILEALLGVGCMLVPAAILAPFGVKLNEIATPFARLFGSALIAFSILLWFARKSDNPGFRNAMAYSMSAYYLASAVILLITQIAGLMNALGWSMVGIHVLLLIWFGYFIVKSRPVLQQR